MLEPVAFPATPGEWPEFLRGWIDQRLEQAQAALEELGDGTERSAEAALELWSTSSFELQSAGSLAGLLAEVHPDEATREIADEGAQRTVRIATEREQNSAVHAALSALGPDDLDTDGARVLAHALRDFRRGGINLDEPGKARLRELSERMTLLDQDISRRIRDDVRSIRIAPERLAGMPQDFIDAHPVGDDGLVELTTDYPDLIPFRTYARDGAARRALLSASLNRAWPENDALLHELFELRHEQAVLLGYSGWADFDAEVKMVGSAQGIEDFIARIAEAAAPAAGRDLAILLERRRQDDPSATTIDAADGSYYSELIRRERYEVDSQEVRRYFDFSRVRDGLLATTGALLGIEYRSVDAPSWHPDVTVYDVLESGEVIGRIHLDLHPREGKFKHAAMFDITPGVAGYSLPEGALACNLPRGLMEHDDVVTLFHEFGHLVHFLLAGRQRWADLAGIATEWDFVEAPSQMLEEWAWDPDVLATFAIDEQGCPIPRTTVERMRAADEFGVGLWVSTQLFYSAVSFELHEKRPEDLTAEVERLRAKYDYYAHIPNTHMQDSFGHLTGYSSAYYTYLWSLVIAKDMFTAFDPDNLLDGQIGRRYRDTVLAAGGSADAAVLVERFLGRPSNFEAFARWVSSGPSR